MHEVNCEEMLDGWAAEKRIVYMDEHEINCPNREAKHFTYISKF